MNTERAKNIMIVLLSALAVALFGLVFVNESRYVLSAAREQAIIDLLERNDVVFSDGVEIMRNFRPMRQLGMTPLEFDFDAILPQFFAGAEFVVEDNIGHIAFYELYDGGIKDEGKTLVFWPEDNRIMLSIPGGIAYDGFILNASTAERLALNQIERIIGPKPNLSTPFKALNYRGDYVLSFFSTYRGHILHNNQIRVRVTNLGITQIVYSYANVHGFEGEARHVFFGDEALIALLNQMRGAGVQGRITIERMHKAYFMESGSHGRGVPAYVFNVVVGGFHFNFVFNAFTNEFILNEFTR